MKFPSGNRIARNHGCVAEQNLEDYDIELIE